MKRALVVSAATALLGLGLSVGFALIGLNYYAEGDWPEVLRWIQCLGMGLFVAGMAVAVVAAATLILRFVSVSRS